LVAGDGEDRLAIQLGVVEAVQQVEAARTRGGQADAELPRVLRVGARHEGGGLLVADLDEPDLLPPRAERLHDAVDAVAGQAENHFDAPVTEGLDQYVGRGVGHQAASFPRRAPSSLGRTSRS
jgi:hypothetical protein